MKFISSRDNSVFKRLRMLAEDSRARRVQMSALIDGDHLLRAAIETNWPVRCIILREDAQDSFAVKALLDLLQVQTREVEVLVLSSVLFNQLSPVVTPTGVMAEIGTDFLKTTFVETEDLLILAGVQDAGNLGSLLRTAVAAGIRYAWLDEKCTQAWSPKALRAGMGAQFCIAIEENCDLQQKLTDFKLPVMATGLGLDSTPLYDLDLRAPVAWLFGSEGQGVPADLLNLADFCVRIPMLGKVESLNVGAAAAACLFEQVRQRFS